MQKVIVICGQTSTGKSDFAVDLAIKLRGLNHSKGMVGRTLQGKVLGEIVSADSRQIYIGMDLGTGKITKKEMNGIPHHMLDIVSPNKVFNVNDYKKLADKKIKEIIKRGNIPIICGGTGFYIDAIINDSVFPKVPPNLKLRLELKNKTTNELFNILKKLDKNRSENIDPNNPMRLIRAIEIATALGSVPPTTHKSDLWPKYKVLKIGLILPDEILKERIYKRILKRIKRGMIGEIRDLHESLPAGRQGLSWARMEDLGLEYRYISQYLQSRMTKSEMLEKLNTESWHYAKRQKTWFKRDKSTIWINPLDKKEVAQILKKVKEFLK